MMWGDMLGPGTKLACGAANCTTQDDGTALGATQQWPQGWAFCPRGCTGGRRVRDYNGAPRAHCPERGPPSLTSKLEEGRKERWKERYRDTCFTKITARPSGVAAWSCWKDMKQGREGRKAGARGRVEGVYGANGSKGSEDIMTPLTEEASQCKVITRHMGLQRQRRRVKEDS